MRLTLLHLTVAILIFSGANNVFGQPETSVDPVPKLLNQSETCANLSKDLSQILAGLPKEYNLIEVMRRMTAWDLSVEYIIIVAESFSEAAKLFSMYELVTDTDKKERAKRFVNDRLDGFIKVLEVRIEYINGQLALQKHPAIIAIGMRMKDELRRGQELLQSIAIE